MSGMWKQNGKVIKKIDQMGKKEKGGKNFELLGGGGKKGKEYIHMFVSSLSRRMCGLKHAFLHQKQT